MKLFLKIVFLLMLPSIARSQQVAAFLQAQQNQIDSLQQVLKHSTNDTLRMEIYRDLGLYYQEVNRDSGLYCAEQQMLLAQKLKLKLWEADGYDFAGYVLNQLGNYPKSLQYFIKGIKIAEDPETAKGIWKLSKFIFGDKPENGRLFVLGMLNSDLAFLYEETGNFEQAVSHFRKAINIGEKIDEKILLGFANMLLGVTNRKMNSPDSAIVLQQKAFDYWKQSGYTKYSGYCLVEIGRVYQKKGDKIQAKEYFNESIPVNFRENSFASIADAYLALANLLKEEGSIDSSLQYAKMGLELAMATGSPTGSAEAYTTLSSIYKLRNKTDSAFIYQGLAMATKDSINNRDKVKQFQNVGFDEQLRQQEVEKEKISYQNKIRIYAMLAGLGVILLVALILYRNNRQKQRANNLLAEQKQKVESTLIDLKSTQSQLIQSEKMASLGELTAGIAHEIQNPLNFVNNFSEVNKELITEMKQEIKKGNFEEVNFIANDIEANEEKINHHGKRADAIVKGMLQHSRSSSGVKEPSDINALTDEYLRLAYHGLKAKDKSLSAGQAGFNATMKTDYDETIGNINIIPQDIGRVILNLITNAFYSVTEKNASTLRQAQGSAGQPYEPTVSVSTKKSGDKILISVKDNGNGIPQKIVDKIFQPFFTTKPAGQGTGLGLSLAYDIVKAHGGEIKVKTEENEGSGFVIELPS